MSISSIHNDKGNNVKLYKHDGNSFGVYPQNFSNYFTKICSERLIHYGKAIAFTEIAAKQGYKPAIFQLALLYLYGTRNVYVYIKLFYNINEGQNTKLNFKNQDKAETMIYNLANTGYKPAIKIINKVYKQNF